MSGPIHKTSAHGDEWRHGKHRFEHWYADNQVYFITARCRDRFPALASEQTKAIFWDRFDHWSGECGILPWIVSLLDNHYHLLAYNRSADGLRHFMSRLHGSVAKLVNDTLPQRRADFWRDDEGREFFDGCIRNAKQARLTFRYVLLQCRRHGICNDPRDYPHTRVYVDCERAIQEAQELSAFMQGVPYQRYEGRGRKDGR
ncbi:MAG: transposase [Phycisphaeraceae bacterium]|nr:transposase [Phycisphaeraceae bacterium]